MHGLECSTVRSRDVTLTQTDRRRLEASEMWIWIRMEKISWLTNEEVVRRVNERQANTELYLAKETSMDWPCFEK